MKILGLLARVAVKVVILGNIGAEIIRIGLWGILHPAAASEAAEPNAEAAHGRFGLRGLPGSWKCLASFLVRILAEGRFRFRVRLQPYTNNS